MAAEKEIAVELARLAAFLERGFWMDPGFWIGNVLNLIGLGLSGLAVWQATKARDAAVEAGRTVKGQSVAIELSEVAQRLDAIPPDISYRQARDILAEITRRVRRVISPYAEDEQMKVVVTELREVLSSARDSLGAVRPSSPAAEAMAPDAVYFGIEDEFAAINNAIADFLGLLETKTIEKGGANGH
jgi:hypothetical protein